MMASHRCLWALMLLVCLGGSYVLTAPADIPVEEGGPENVVASQGNPVVIFLKTCILWKVFPSLSMNSSSQFVD